MIISNNDLFSRASTSILENATYLYESEMPNVSAYSIPVVANDRFNAGIVSYEDISRLCENNGIEIVDGIRAVAEANNIDPNDLVVSIDESTIIMDPYVIDEVHQYVVQPVSESNIVSQYTDAMVGAWLESGDDFYLEAIGEPELMLEADEEDDRSYSDKNFVSSQDIKRQSQQYREGIKKLKGMSTTVGDKTIKPDDPNFLVKIKRFLTDKPREYLARAVARLRQTYRKFLLRADKENDQDKIKWYKQIARKILQAVDWVLSKIQKAASINYEKRANKYAMNYADKLKDAGYGKNTKGKVDNTSHYNKNAKGPERVKGVVVTDRNGNRSVQQQYFNPDNLKNVERVTVNKGGAATPSNTQTHNAEPPKTVITNSQYEKALRQHTQNGTMPVRMKGHTIKDPQTGEIIRDKNGDPIIVKANI